MRINFMYSEFEQYLIDNELFDLAEDLKNDTNDAELVPFVLDHFNDSEMLKDLSTGLIKEMLLYYINNKEKKVGV